MIRRLLYIEKRFLNQLVYYRSLAVDILNNAQTLMNARLGVSEKLPFNPPGITEGVEK